VTRIAMAISLAACLLLGATACSSSDGGGDAASPYVASLKKNLETAKGNELKLTAKQADCLAPKWIDTITPERLEKAGIEPADLATSDTDASITKLKLSDATAGSLIDAYGDCGVGLKKAFIDNVGSGSTMSADDKACLDEAITDDLLRDVLVATLTKGADALTNSSPEGKALITAVSACPGALGAGS